MASTSAPRLSLTITLDKHDGSDTIPQADIKHHSLTITLGKRDRSDTQDDDVRQPPSPSHERRLSPKCELQTLAEELSIDWNLTASWTKPGPRMLATLSKTSTYHLRNFARASSLTLAQVKAIVTALTANGRTGNRAAQDWSLYAGRALLEAFPRAVSEEFVVFAARTAFDHGSFGQDSMRWAFRQQPVLNRGAPNFFLMALFGKGPIDSIETFRAIFGTVSLVRTPVAIECAIRSSDEAIPKIYNDERMYPVMQSRDPAGHTGIIPGTEAGYELLKKYSPTHASSRHLVDALCKSANLSMLSVVASPMNVTKDHFRSASFDGLVDVLNILEEKAGSVVTAEELASVKHAASHHLAATQFFYSK